VQIAQGAVATVIVSNEALIWFWLAVTATGSEKLRGTAGIVTVKRAFVMLPYIWVVYTRFRISRRDDWLFINRAIRFVRAGKLMARMVSFDKNST